MPTIEHAIQLALDAHKGQIQRNGLPYILHPLAVMEKVTTEEEKITAVLHDVIEDTGVTMQILREAGYSERVIAALDALTRRDGEKYEAFIQRAKQNPLARRVKIADIEHNMDVRRLPEVTPTDAIRLNKYNAAWLALQDNG